MTRFTIIFGLFLVFVHPIYGQKTGNDIDRYTIDSIQGVYIPKDLDDCIKQIDKFLNDSIKLEITRKTEDEFSSNAHFGLGLRMRNNWQLWGGSRLSKYFNELGIFHPDDISGIIIDSYYRHLNNKDIKLAEQIKYYQDYWEKYKDEELERNKKEFAEYIVGDTVSFNYNLGFATTKQEKDFDKEKCIAKGIIIEKNEDKFLIKIRLVNGCGKKGIIIYDSENVRVYNEKTKKLEKPIKREIRYLKKGMENWFNFFEWETD